VVFDALRRALWEDLNPWGAIEEVLVDKIVADAWRLRRVPALEAALHTCARQEWDDYPEEEDAKNDPIFAVAQALGLYAHQFANLSRHEEALTKSMLRGLH
jgi:hypothetical protein